MIELELVTREGHPVTRIDVPPFQLQPEVVVWGERFFVRDETKVNRYREACAYWVTPSWVEL